MRLTRPQPATECPPAAYDLLTPEHRLDDGIEFDPQRDISKKDWEGMKGELEKHRGRNWWYFSTMAMRLSLLFPDRKAELNLNDEAFDWMKRELEVFRGTDWKFFSGTAFDLTILAAQDARITPDGRIEITPKKRRLAVEPTPLPARPR